MGKTACRIDDSKELVYASAMPIGDWRGVAIALGVTAWVIVGCGGSDPSSTSLTEAPTSMSGTPETVAGTDDTGATPSGADNPTPVAATPIPTPEPLDLAAVRALVGDATHLVEFLGCGGVGIAPATALSPTVLVTDPRVAELSQLTAVVSASGEAAAATVAGRSSDGLTVVEVEGEVIVAVRASAGLAPGDQVAVLGAIAADGSPTDVSAVVAAADPPTLDLGGDSGLAAAGAAVYTAAGGFAGVVVDDAGAVATTPTATTSAVPAPAACDPLDPPLDPTLATVVLDRGIREVALAQELATALATGQWDRVRELDTPKARLTDAEFEAGWGTLDMSTMVPLSSAAADSATRWRLGLVAHETIDGNRTTRVFCVSWDVDVAAGTVVQTGIDSIRFDDEPDWRDPFSYRERLEDSC